MNGLITISENGGRQNVSARDLHTFLEVTTPFVKWIERMLEYGFVENQDYAVTDIFVPNPKGGRQSITDYVLSLDCAKEIAMLQRSEKGKQARQYFIDVEKKMRSLTVMSVEEMIIAQAQSMIETKRQLAQIAEEQQSQRELLSEIDARTTTRPEYFTIVGYAVFNKIKIGLNNAAKYGQYAARICKERGYPVDTIPDPRFGKVGSYPTTVLREVFSMPI